MRELTYASPDEALADALRRAQALAARTVDVDTAQELHLLCRLIEAVHAEMASAGDLDATGSDGDALYRAGVSCRVPSLTPREQQVLQLMTAGLRNKEIAAQLGITERTAAFHVGNVLAKLGADGRVEAVRIALQTGMIALA